MLKLIMVLLWMILLVVLLCAEAENVTEVRGELGTNVTLTCSNQTSGTHWYMEIYSQFRACVSCQISSTHFTYNSPDFETKFSLLGNKLMIKNFSAGDCRLYFCGINRNDSIHFVETFRLVSVFLSPDIFPTSESDPQQQSSSISQHHLLIIYRSAFLITAITLVILVVVFTSLWVKRKSLQVRSPRPVTSWIAETVQSAQDEIHSNPPCH
ncbi:uncharacterized protein LOC109204443 isoform X1 [Oreochromis niloticus]|uniref:uncharacterized protein LOC109204443 isoform X1 n=2 Tax=Oreochromis niloticus TaxID=8128 RepID=UPI0009050343|nr:uncharacterized protein LOC109204443 isoform X1 [Oreochromis niloticus]